MVEPLVLVLGARGMLGTDVMAALAAAGVPAMGLDLPDFDITDAAALCSVLESCGRGDYAPNRPVDGSPAAVINCAAYTDVEGAEDDEALAHRINADAVGALGRLAAEAGVYVVHVSTDFVFDGRKDGAYTEADEPNPLSAYGRTKLAGERALVESGCRHGILRIQWTYGRAGRHFVSKVADLARSRDRIKVVDDQIGAPTATTEVAAAILALLGARAEGLYHFAAAGVATRFDVARVIVGCLGLATVVEPCTSDTFPMKADRPANSRFDCTRIEALLGRPIRPWREVLAEYLEEGR
ncbi:MAG: dTDP-4-dehydrorhamnose reductase [Pseudomonadota bacterium]